MSILNPFDAVNNFFYFSFNYPVVHYRWSNATGKHDSCIPEFLTKVEWGCNEAYIIEKWLNLESDQYGKMFEFYAGLDNKNREALVNWIMDNYDG